MQLIVVHVPKTAGLSLTSALQSKYGAQSVLRVRNDDQEHFYEGLSREEKAEYQVCIAHRALNLLEDELPRARIVSVLRDPIDRQMSLYKHSARHPHHKLHDLACQGLTAWINAHEADPALAWRNSVARWFSESPEARIDTVSLQQRVEFFFTDRLQSLWEDLSLPLVEPKNVRPPSDSMKWTQAQFECAERIWSYDIEMYRALREAA